MGSVCFSHGLDPGYLRQSGAAPEKTEGPGTPTETLPHPTCSLLTTRDCKKVSAYWPIDGP